jgi:hypothetical protein
MTRILESMRHARRGDGREFFTWLGTHSDEHRPEIEREFCDECATIYRRSKYASYSTLSDIQKAKANARSYANTYQRRGRLQPQPCEDCGATEGVEKHHLDYALPLLVRWLCRVCHMKNHPSKRST